MDYLLVVLILLLGGTMLFKPELVWKLENTFLKRGEHPMEGYLVVMRMMGAFFLLFGALGGVYMFIK